MFTKLSLATVLILFLVGASSGFAITKVAPKYNMIEVQGSYADPIGTLQGTPFDPFVWAGHGFDIEAGNVYKPGFAIAASYGTLINGRWLPSIGFRYTRNEFQDMFVGEDDTYIVEFSLGTGTVLSQWDLDFNLNYGFIDLKKGPASPYVGLGLHPGLSTIEFQGFSNETHVNFAAGLNFGADVKIWSGYGQRSFVTLSSINSWNFFATGDRPRHVTIGGGIKYFFKN